MVLIWNERKTSSDFEQAYDALILKHAHNYKKVSHRNIDKASIDQFFNPQPCELRIFSNHQTFDYEGLEGRLLSSSYMPAKDSDDYSVMKQDLQLLFEQYQHDGSITIHYDTKVYVGRLS